ncbi:MAG: hypothetical protein ABIL68_11105 [bacterium]
MKTCIKAMLTFLLMLFFITQCSKDTSVAPETETDPTLEIMEMANEIDALDDVAFTDSSDVDRPRLLRRALFRLDELLDQVHILLVRHDNAEADSLYRSAREAQKNAIEAARIDSFHVAFDFIKESQHLALEAVRLIKGDVREDREAMLRRLREEMAEVRLMLDEIEGLLVGQTNERAEMAFRRAKQHFRMATEAIQDRKLRDAGFHVLRSKRYAQLALRILKPTD